MAAQAQFTNNYGYGVGGFLPGALPLGVTASQYHAQDELGQARFGYAHPGQAATNYRDALGNQIGSYAYINPEGKEIRVSYTADSRGFRVLSNDLPVAPVANLVAPVQVQDTPEVAAAKATHLAALAAARTPKVAPAVPATASKTVAPVAPVAPKLVAPLPVQDTPEVAAAKREHFLKWNAAKAATDAAKLRYYGVPSVYNYGVPLAYNMPYTPFATRGVTYV